MKSWHFRNAEAPCVVFMNGIGDHVLVLPAIRALVSLYPRRLTIVAHRAVAELFFGRLATERLVAVQSYAFSGDIAFHFDVEAVAREIGAADLFISLSTGRSASITDLARRLAPRLSIGFFDEFDLVAARPRGIHSARWYFDMVRLLDARLRFSEFTAPPALPKQAHSKARKIAERLAAGSRLLVVHNETAIEKMWDRERFADLIRQFVAARPDCRVVDVGTNRDKVLPLAAGSLPDISAGMNLKLATALALVSEADMFCGVDSCMLHVADFHRIPGVGLFGPTDPAEFGFQFAPHRHVRARRGMDLSTAQVRRALDRIWAIAQHRRRPLPMSPE